MHSSLIFPVFPVDSLWRISRTHCLSWPWSLRLPQEEKEEDSVSKLTPLNDKDKVKKLFRGLQEDPKKGTACSTVQCTIWNEWENEKAVRCSLCRLPGWVGSYCLLPLSNAWSSPGSPQPSWGSIHLHLPHPDKGTREHSVKKRNRVRMGEGKIWLILKASEDQLYLRGRTDRWNSVRQLAHADAHRHRCAVYSVSMLHYAENILSVS